MLSEFFFGRPVTKGPLRKRKHTCEDRNRHEAELG